MNDSIQHANGQAEQDRQEARHAFERFIAAFSGLNWEAFRACFADDVTFFFPYIRGRWEPLRANGWGEVEAVFKPFFERLRAEQGEAAHLRIEPVDVVVQMLGDVAIVTFHLDDEPGRLGRRTGVFQRRGSEWLIVHVHSSIVEL